MRAVYLDHTGPPEVMTWREMPTPECGAHQVLVRMEAAGVNPVDTYLRAGGQGYQPPLPWTPGLDGAGTLVEVGKAVVDWQPGDRVYLSGSLTGTYAELALCRPEQIHPLPASLSFAEGACLGVPYATAWRALVQRGRATAGETLFIHGASGGVGLAALQLGQFLGLRVAGSSSPGPGQEIVRAQGAELIVDHADPEHGRQVLAWTGGEGVNLLLEMQAERNLGLDLTLMAPRGRVVVIGSRGSVEITPREAMMRELDICGLALLKATDAELATIHQALAEAMAAGAVRPVIAAALPLPEAPQAHKLLQTHHAGKYVLMCAPAEPQHELQPL